MSKRAAFLSNAKRRARRFRRNEIEPQWEEWAEETEARLAPERKKAAAVAKAKATRAKNAEAKRLEQEKAAKAKAAKTRARNKPKTKKEQKAASSRRGSRTAAYNAARRDGKSEAAAARVAVAKVKLRAGETFKGLTSSSGTTTAKKTRVGKSYTRLNLRDPSSGKVRASWMYRTKTGKVRRIPTEAILASGAMKKDTLVKRREAAAARILKSGSVFVANKKKGKTMAGKKTKKTKKGKKPAFNIAAYNAAIRAGKSKAAAQKAARSGKAPKKAARKAARGAAKKTTRKATAKRAARKVRTIQYEWIRGAAVAPVRRVKAAKKSTKKSTKKAGAQKGWTAAKRKAAAKKAAQTRKRNAKMKKNARKHSEPLVSTKTGQPIRVVKVMSKNGRRSRRSRRGMRRNAFMAQLMSVLKTGLFVTGGFLTHKLLTNLVIEHGVNKLKIESLQTNATFQTWKKPLVGVLTLAIGVPIAQKLLKRNSTEVAAGMAASLFQSVIVTALSKKPAWQARLSGYSNSRAYALRGPMERHAFSIAPQYAAVRGYQQAAAGFQQAAAGYKQAAAGMGEYFSANGVGEYFATNGLQGVGSYEAAGQLALQAAAGADEVDDGIRPDSDIDGLLDLAEAAAGLRGTGEFYTAVKESGGRVVAKRVGEQSQWVPAGPLWAGASFVDDTQDTSELPAGILSTSGGNGSLST
jgi:hypothetical protein